MILDRGSLSAAIASGQHVELRSFYGHTPRTDGRLSDAVFSQWWAGHPFEVGKEGFATAEHFMMAGKARIFADEEKRAQILAAPSATEAKSLGKEVHRFDEARWAEVRFDLVTDGSVQKFGAHPALREHLLSTGEAILVEAAPRDAIWGVGVGAEKARDPTRWRGLNLLGFALVRARAILRGEHPALETTPWR